MDYIEFGYDRYFRRNPFKKRVRDDTLPDLSQYTTDSIIQAVSGSKIAGGIIQSKDGKLTLDLDKGKMLYNDGVVDLLSLGGKDNNIVIKNSSDTTLVTST